MRRLVVVAAAVMLSIAVFTGGWHVAAAGPVGTGSPSPAPAAPLSFNHVDDYQLQLSELTAFVGDGGLPRHFIQGGPAGPPKHYEYQPAITRPYGYNACGPVAAAGAFGGAGWVSLVRVIIFNAPRGSYGRNTGIQPQPFTTALKATFGADQVSAKNDWTLGEMYEELQNGNVVIVDIQTGRYDNPAAREFPTTRPPNYSHFARVLGMNLDAGQIYLENDLRPAGSSVWTVPLSTFWETWKFPEKDVSLRVRGYDPTATRWAVVIQRGARPVGSRR